MIAYHLLRDIGHLMEFVVMINGEIISGHNQDFPGGPAVKTLCSQCRGPGFDPWSGN